MFIEKPGLNIIFNNKIVNVFKYKYASILDVEQEKLIKLLSNLKEDNLVNGHIVQEAFKSLCSVLSEKENEVTKVISSASILFATAICEHLIPLSDVASMTENGAHNPLFLLVLQHIHKKQGKSELSEIFNKSKVRLESAIFFENA